MGHNARVCLTLVRAGIPCSVEKQVCAIDNVIKSRDTYEKRDRRINYYLLQSNCPAVCYLLQVISNTEFVIETELYTD